MMDCYSERAHLLAILSRHYVSKVFIPNDAEPGFSRGLVIFIAGRQATWHIADDDMHLFDHLPVEPHFQWDGHTTEEKYALIREISRIKRI